MWIPASSNSAQFKSGTAFQPVSKQTLSLFGPLFGSLLDIGSVLLIHSRTARPPNSAGQWVNSIELFDCSRFWLQSAAIDASLSVAHNARLIARYSQDPEHGSREFRKFRSRNTFVCSSNFPVTKLGKRNEINSIFKQTAP